MKFIKTFEKWFNPIIDISGSMSSSGDSNPLGYFVQGVDENKILSKESKDSIFMTFEEFAEFEKRNLVIYEGDLPYGQPVRTIYNLSDKQEILDELELMRTAKKYNL